MPLPKGNIPWNKGKKTGQIPWNKGKHWSQSTKKKISTSKLGKVPWNRGKHLSEEHKKNLSASHRDNYLSDSTKFKLSQALRGRIPWNAGKILPAEMKRKISESLKGHIGAWWGKHHSPKTKSKISEANRGENHPLWNKHHSKETRQKMSESHKGLQTGSNNPAWKGGITPLTIVIRTSVIYKLWRKAVFIRDRFQCQDCGKIGGNLHAHHVYPFERLLKDYRITSFGQAIRTEELWDIALGTILCKKCHKKRHQRRSQILEELEENEDLSSYRHSPGRDKAISGLERAKEISD